MTDPLWEQRQDRAPCDGKHTWIYYHSRGIRECCDCDQREQLWADFGLVKKGQNDDHS